jgi:twitching motility two-component system response regulator PilH
MGDKKVFVVEDSPTDLHTIRSALEPQGYSVVTATDGEEALRRVGAERPDLVLLDVVLPKMSGFEVCRELKTAPETSDIKIVMISAKKEYSDRFWGLKQGAEDYVTKPIEKDTLLDVVSRYV